MKIRSPAVAGLTILTVLLGACGRATYDKSAGTTSVHSPSQHVGGSGMVVARSAAAATFCSGPFPAVSRLPLRPPSCAGISVVGVSLSALSHRTAIHGVTWGDAYLAGTFSNGILHVSEQGPPRADSSYPELADPPCSAPARGWATSPLNELSTDAVAAYQRQFPADVTSVAIFNPRPRTWVVTIASTSPERTIARLSGAYRDRLCVVRSRYELSSVRAASKAARALLSPSSYGQLPYRVTAVGMTTGTDGQPIVEVDVVAYTKALRRALGSQPAGLVRIVPWLQPVSG